LQENQASFLYQFRTRRFFGILSSQKSAKPNRMSEINMPISFNRLATIEIGLEERKQQWFLSHYLLLNQDFGV
jgi:hypothetical protein